MASKFFSAFLMSITIIGVYSFPCRFNRNCTCDLDGPYLRGVCDDFDKVPPFNESDRTISSLIIRGRFDHIFEDTFMGLRQNVLNLILQTTEVVPESRFLELLATSFNTDHSVSEISSIKFVSYINISGLKAALPNAHGMTELIFDKCTFPTLADNTFAGTRTLTKLVINEGDLVSVQDDAFNGTESTLGQLILSNNKLVEISPALETLDVLVELDLSGNDFKTVGENRFPPNVMYLDLSDNKHLEYINQTSFDFVAHLKSINLDRCNFTDIPDFLPIVSNSVENIQMNANNIDAIDFSFNHSYPNLKVFPGFDDNPINIIYRGAYNGLEKVEKAELNYYYELKSFDLSASFQNDGMRSIKVTNFPKLEHVNFTEYTTLSTDLKLIALTYCNKLAKLDLSFGKWLQSSKDRLLDISDNPNFDCTNPIQWMAESAFCSFHPQIMMNNTYCADTGVPLEAYLRKFAFICNA